MNVVNLREPGLTGEMPRTASPENPRHARVMNALFGIAIAIGVLGMLVALGSYLMISFLALD